MDVYILFRVWLGNLISGNQDIVDAGTLLLKHGWIEVAALIKMALFGSPFEIFIFLFALAE